MKNLVVILVAVFIFNISYAQNFEWAKAMGGIFDDYVTSIAVDAGGNVYTTGFFWGTVDFDPGAGTYNLTSAGNNYDIFISKLDANGNFLWAINMGGTSSTAGGYSIAVDAGGNVYTTGSFWGTVDFDPGAGTYNLIAAGNYSDIFISKLDANGNFLWAKRMGGFFWDTGTSIAVDASGNVHTTGSFWGTVDFDPGTGTYNLTSAGFDNDIFISKLDASGNFLWAKSMGGTSNDWASSIAVDAVENVYTTGNFVGTADFDPGPGTYNLTSAGSADIFISKLDSNGNFLWAKSLGGNIDDGGNSIAVDAGGNVYTTGGFQGTADFDPGPGTYNLTSAGDDDIFISKLDISGNFLWARRLGGNSYDHGNSIALDAGGNVYITGYFEGTVDFDPGPGTYNLTSAGNYDIFISKLDISGNFLWAKRLGGNSYDIGRSIAVDAPGNVYTTGVFQGTIDFDPGPGTYNLTSAGDNDIFVIKLNQCTPPVLTISTTNSLCPGGSGSATVNATGNAPFIYSWSNGQTTQTATGLPTGNHTVIVTDDSSCAAMATVIITEPAAIVSNITATPTNYSSPNCNGSVAINPSGGTAPFTITWNSGSTTNLCEGWYVTTITDANNCVKTDSVYVNFVTGIEELNAAGISVFPNPVNDVIIINSEKMEIDEIKIYDINGKLIKHEIINSSNLEVDVTEFETGIYFINMKSSTVKIIKK
jgi:hypothetical protein